MATRKQFHEACKILYKQVQTNKQIKDNAICESLYYAFKMKYPLGIEDISKMVNKYSQGWPKHSGQLGYPVPGGLIKFLNSTDNYWKGQYGKDRVELLKYLIHNTR